MIEREPVQSSNLVSVGYDAGTQTLQVEFRDGSVYQYFDVPERVHGELMAAPSKGAYLAANVKGVYRYART